MITDLNIHEAVSCLDEAVRDFSNPLKQGLPLKSENIFIDMVKFGLMHNKELIYTILCLTTSNTREFDHSTVIITAKICMAMSSTINSNNSTYLKLQGLMMQSCGLTDVGINCLAKLGESITSRNLLNVRTDLAIKDEDNVKELSMSLHNVTVLDNLDRTVRKVLQHQTLPVLLYRKIPREFYSKETEKKTLEDALKNFSTSFFSIDSDSNIDEKRAFLQVKFLHLYVGM